ncbi:hypothetical protein [Sphaerisporangium corydalis]|uniref:Uncharacterized protein n=1 Tax=Sphaerisporangium corydalis TaxID=1441875 RepID=A0ABV9EUT4_9ACTN|nr:hypothetical protein [Sphaerisporangium corydalis]
MDRSDGRVLVIFLIAMILFAVGRLYQRTVNAWEAWKGAIKAAADAAAKIPGAKSAAWAAVWRMIFVGTLTVVLVAVIANAFRYI